MKLQSVTFIMAAGSVSSRNFRSASAAAFNCVSTNKTCGEKKKKKCGQLLGKPSWSLQDRHVFVDVGFL